jgi:hypothetical protein
MEAQPSTVLAKFQVVFMPPGILEINAWRGIPLLWIGVALADPAHRSQVSPLPAAPSIAPFQPRLSTLPPPESTAVAELITLPLC